MQVQPGFNLLQAISGSLQPATGRPQQTEAVQPARSATPAQRNPVPETMSNASAINMNAPRGTYLNIRV